jgi:hypothetical protein
MGNDSIVGTWKLVSAVVKPAPGGETRNLWGENPSGLLTYTGDGRMSAIIASGGRRPLSAADPDMAPAEERAEAFATFGAYAGGYTFDGDRVTHHVEIAWFQNWVGTDQIRFVSLQGSRLTLSTAPVWVGGVQVPTELTWQRLT